MTGIQRFLKKNLSPPLVKPFGRNYIQKLQKESKINVKSKIVNPIYDNKHFAEDFLEIHFHTRSDRYYISDESADICIKYLKNEN